MDTTDNKIWKTAMELSVVTTFDEMWTIAARTHPADTEEKSEEDKIKTTNTVTMRDDCNLNWNILGSLICIVIGGFALFLGFFLCQITSPGSNDEMSQCWLPVMVICVILMLIGLCVIVKEMTQIILRMIISGYYLSSDNDNGYINDGIL